MDTLSSSVAPLNLQSFSNHSTTRDLHLLKAPTRHSSPQRLATSIYAPNSTTSTFHQSTNSFAPPSLFQFSSISPPHPLHNFHKKAASGYAAALFATAQNNNTVLLIEIEAKRLSKVLRNAVLRNFMNDDTVSEKDKQNVVKEVVGKGRFNASLVRLVNLLVGKGKFGMISEVLGEFERIYDEIRGVKVVIVSSMKKLKEEELMRIAKQVQMTSGAERVKVKNVVDEKSAMELGFAA